DDVDPVAGAEDVRLHLRVPPAGLVAEVDSRLEQVFHGDISHAGSLIRPSFPRTWRKTGPIPERPVRTQLGGAVRVTGSSSRGTPGSSWCPCSCRAGTRSPRPCSAWRGACAGV